MENFNFCVLKSKDQTVKYSIFYSTFTIFILFFNFIGHTFGINIRTLLLKIYDFTQKYRQQAKANGVILESLIFNFEHITQLVLVVLLLALYM